MIPTAPAMTVPIRVDENGSIRVGGTRVLLEVIIACHQRDETPEQIHSGFPTVKLADIYAVISYYLDHQELVDDYIRQQDEEGERIRSEIRAKRPDMFALEDKLRERLAHREK